MLFREISCAYQESAREGAAGRGGEGACSYLPSSGERSAYLACERSYRSHPVEERKKKRGWIVGRRQDMGDSGRDMWVNSEGGVRVASAPLNAPCTLTRTDPPSDPSPTSLRHVGSQTGSHLPSPITKFSCRFLACLFAVMGCGPGWQASIHLLGDSSREGPRSHTHTPFSFRSDPRNQIPDYDKGPGPRSRVSPPHGGPHRVRAVRTRVRFPPFPFPFVGDEVDEGVGMNGTRRNFSERPSPLPPLSYRFLGRRLQEIATMMLPYQAMGDAVPELSPQSQSLGRTGSRFGSVCSVPVRLCHPVMAGQRGCGFEACP